MYRIGIDLGGTNIAVGVVDDGHAIVSRVSVPTMASRPAAEVVRDMGGAVEQVLARARGVRCRLPQHGRRFTGHLQLCRRRGGASV